MYNIVHLQELTKTRKKCKTILWSGRKLRISRNCICAKHFHFISKVIKSKTLSTLDKEMCLLERKEIEKN